jgi:hypothetical protein
VQAGVDFTGIGQPNIEMLVQAGIDRFGIITAGDRATGDRRGIAAPNNWQLSRSSVAPPQLPIGIESGLAQFRH